MEKVRLRGEKYLKDVLGSGRTEMGLMGGGPSGEKKGRGVRSVLGVGKNTTGEGLPLSGSEKIIKGGWGGP